MTTECTIHIISTGNNDFSLFVTKDGCFWVADSDGNSYCVQIKNGEYFDIIEKKYLYGEFKQITGFVYHLLPDDDITTRHKVLSYDLDKDSIMVEGHDEEEPFELSLDDMGVKWCWFFPPFNLEHEDICSDDLEKHQA